MLGIFIMALAYVFSQFSRAFLAVLKPVFTSELGMTSVELAYASGAWFMAFALFQFLVGILLDSLGPRKTAGYIFTIFAGGGMFLFAYATSSQMIIIATALIGIGCSPALMAPFYIFVRNYDAAKLATLTSVFIAVGTLGNIASSEPLAAAIELWGWRDTAKATGIVVLLIGAGIFLTLKDPEKVEQTETGNGYLTLFKIKELWPIFPIILGGYMVAAGLRGSWIGPFHEELYGYDTLQIGRATLYMSISIALGTLFFGPLDRIFNSRKWVVMSGSLIVLITCLLMAISLPENPVWAIAGFVSIGFFGASYAVQMAHGKAFIPAHLTGRGVTLLNFCSIGGAGVFQWLSGPVVKVYAVVDEPAAQYEALFIFYGVLVAIAMVSYAFAKDAKP